MINNAYVQQNFNTRWHFPLQPCMLMPNTKALDHLAKLSLKLHCNYTKENVIFIADVQQNS